MANSNIEFKAMPGQVNIDEAQGIVECFVAGIGNKDSVGDVLIAGAFSKSLQRRKPRVVWGHNWNDPIGKVLEIYEVPPGDRRLPAKMLNAGIGGLYARVQFNLNSEKGREAFANVAFFGQEQEWSIGYKTLDAIFDPNIQANVLKEVELYEVSPVLHGANQLTGTISVKSDELALAEEEKGWGMMGQHHMMGQMPMKPNVIVIREDDDDDDKYESEKPIFSEGLAQPISGGQRQRLEQEIMERTGSQVRLVEATENTAVFQRMMPNGTPMTFRIGYHTPDNYSTFMFGKPELVDGQNKPSQFGGKPSGSRVVVPSQMPMMPMQVKPGYDPNNMVVLPKSDLSGQLEELEDALMAEINEKVGRTINKRNLSKLKSILENLQEVISSAEKEDMDTKGYLIPVQLESAFHTKSMLDPIFDYHRVESVVTEDGILITSGVTKDLVEAIDNAQKGIGRTLGGGLGKGRAAGRAAFARFDPNAWDGDGDGLVQEGTPFQRPAIPGVNDRATGGKVNARRAIQAYQGGGGFASSSSKPEIVSDFPEKVEDVIDQTARIIVGKGNSRNATNREGDVPSYLQEDYDRVVSELREIFAPLTKAKVKESPGKAISETRKNLAEKLADEKFIESLDSDERIDNLIYAAQNAVEEAMTDRFLEIQRTGTKSDAKEFEDLAYELEQDFREMSEKIGTRAKDFYSKRKEKEVSDIYWGRSKVPLRPEEAKKEAKDYLNDLIYTVENGLEGETLDWDDFVSFLSSRDGAAITRGLAERIRSGEVDADDLQYELEQVLEHVQNLDPTLQPEDLANRLRKALKKGGEKNPKLKEISDGYGDDEITGGDLIDELRRIQKDSLYRPDRGKNEREMLRGFASRSNINNIGFDRDTPDPGFDDGPLDGESADKVLEAAGDAQEAFQEAVLPSILDEDQWGMLDAFAKRRKQIFEKLSPSQRKRAEKETAGMSSGEVRDWMQSLAEDDDELMDAIGTTAVQGIFDNEISFGDEVDGEIYDRVLRHAEKTVGSRSRGRGSRSRRGGFASAAGGPKPRGEDEIRAVREMAKAHPELSEEDLNQMAAIARIGSPEDLTELAKRLKKPERVVEDLLDEFGDRRDRTGEFGKRGGFASSSGGLKARGEDEIRAVREMAKAHPELSEEDLNEMAVIARIGSPEDVTPLAKRLKISEREVEDLLDEFGDRRDRTGEFGKPGGFASSGRMDREEDGADYDEAFGPRERRPGRGMRNDPVGDEVADRLDRDEQNRIVRQGFASSGSPVDYDESTGPGRRRSVSEIIEDQPIDDNDEQVRRRNRQQRALRPEWQRRADERRAEDGFASTSRGGKEKNQIDMTLEEYAEIQDSINNVIKKLEEGDFGADEEIEKLKELTEKIEDSRLANDMIPLDDEELTEYLGMLEAMRDGGVGMDDVSSDDKNNIDSLINALKEAQQTGSSESQKLKDSGTRLAVAGKSTRSQTRNRKLTSDGTLTPDKKLSITLDDDRIALLIEEADMIADNTKDRQSIATIKKILEDAKGGKFEVTPEQFDSITRAIEDAFENGLVTSDIYGVLHQAAENPDGKYDLNDFIDPPKPSKGFASTNKINNGAPSDITESMQKEFIFWARRQRGLRVAQSIVEDFDKNGGQLKASQWKALRTMYGNMGPGSGGGGFASNTSRPTAGFRDVTGPQGQRSLPYVHQTSGWKKVGGAGGLNEASVMEDPKTGKRYYVKHTRAGEEFRGESEILTSKLYQLLGIGTINYERGIHNGKLQRVSEWNRAINSNVDHSRMSRDPEFRRSMQGTLIANAWLANWDGTGNMSNIVELNGQAVMADSGGGLLFRAQRYSGMKGQGGTDSFGPRVEEVWNLIHGTTRGGQRVQAGVSRAYYSDITPDEIARQVKELGKITDDDIKKLVAQTISNPEDGDRLAQILIARRDWIVDHWGTGKFVEKPSDTSRSDASGAKARPFASVSSRSGGFASSSIDGPGDDTDKGRSGMGARGVGQMVPGGNIKPGRARREGERNRAGTEVGAETRFAGKKFEEVKPDNWDELTLDEKWQWATTYGNPENAENKNDAMSVVEYRKLLNGLMEEEDKADLESMTPAERRAEQRRRAAEKRELDNMGFMPEGSENRRPATKPQQAQDDEKALRVKKSKTAEDAKKEREARLDGILEAIEKYRTKFDSDESENDAHRDIWDSVSDSIQEGGFDFTIRSLDRAIADLDEYIGEYEDEAQNSAERLNLKRARALRKQLASARAGYAENPWIVGGKNESSGGFASSSGGIQSAEKIKSSSKKLAKDIKTDIKKLQGTGNPGTRGFASTSSGGKTMITDEATFFRDVEKSLDKEIRRATKAGDKRAVKGLSKLAEIIRRDEASKTGSRRTNVGSIYFTVEEADEILDGLMFALDTQLEDGGEKRVGWYSKLIEMVAKAAKSTFIDKTTKEITETTRTATNSRGQKKKINIVPEA